MDYLERIAGEWYERAPELAEWVLEHLVNRTDVWGRYTRRKSDEASRALTVPFRDERGKVFLDGSYWNAASAVDIEKGRRVRIDSFEGLLVHVSPMREKGSES